MTSLSKTNIKEANEHLQQLNQRIYDLETQLQLHILHVEDLQKNNLQLKKHLSKETAEKEELKRKIESKDKLIDTLLVSAEEKDQTMIKMEAKSRLFHELIEHKGSLEKILQVLDEVSKSCDQSHDLAHNGVSDTTLEICNNHNRHVKD